ncbi:MAG: RagB/SusD family nutrient uptake outer membrane protein [Niabella sp.]
MTKYNYLYYSLAVWILFNSISCTKLTEDPKSFIVVDNFYKTEADAIAAVDAIYFSLNNNLPEGQHQMYGSLFNTAMDMMTDDVTSGPGTPNPNVRELAILTHSSTNIRVEQMWQQQYIAINKANAAIDHIADMSIREGLKSRLLGESKFLRALFYFNLVRLFGDVPLLLTDQTSVPIEELQVARTPATEVYAQIIRDLEEAANFLKNGVEGEAGRATEGAAVSLLAKVYLTKREWGKAVQTAESVINGSYGYNLMADYSHVFLPAYKNNKEHIFSAQFKGFAQGQGHASTSRAIRSGVPGLRGTYGDQVVFYKKGSDNNFSVFKLYSARDNRKNVTFVTRFQSPTNGQWYGSLIDPSVPGDSVPYFNKYWDPDAVLNTSESAANTPILRFAEVLLVHAEAENELNGPTAKAYISYNRVRQRANLLPLSGLTKDQFRDSLYLDRRLELIYEFQRYFDLIRQIGSETTGVGPESKGILLKSLREAGKTNVAERHYLYPIPYLEIQRNPKLTQNPGWD